MSIAITTPTGNIGKPLAHHLLDAGAEITLLARDPAKVQDLVDRGARVAQGDLTDADFVKSATEGAHTLFWLNPPRFDVEDFVAYYEQLSQIGADAVTANGIERTILLSSIGAQLDHGTGVVLGLHAAEAILGESVQNITMLRPNFFMENFLSYIPTMKDMGSMFLPARPEAVISPIATRDIAQSAAARILDSSWSGKTVVELHGVGDMSLAEAAKTISDAVDKPIQAVQVSVEQAVEALMGMGMSTDCAQKLAELYVGIDEGSLRPEFERTAESTSPTTLEQFAKEVLAPALQ